MALVARCARVCCVCWLLQLTSEPKLTCSRCLLAESGIDILLAQPGIAKTNIFDKSDLNPTEKPAAQLQVTAICSVV